MSVRSILAVFRSVPRLSHARAVGRRAGFRLRFEPLEDRCLLSFSPVTSYPVGADPQAVATADFNNDGKLDLATANHGGNTFDFDGSFSVLLGDGRGGFGAARQFDAGANLQSLAVGDFNNDGNLDLAAVDDFSWGTVVWLGDGAGGFVWTPGSGSRFKPQSVAVADFNADGNLDLVNTSLDVESFGDSYVEVQLGDGRGGFTTGYFGYISGNSAVELAVADLNADGKPDVVAASESSLTVSVLLGNGDGTLSYTVGSDDFATGNNTRAVAVGDFNGDGIPDLLAGGYSRVAVLPGNGDGTLGSPITTLTNNSDQRGVAAADFNGDGRLDVVTADRGEGTVTALLGLGNGTFTLVGDHASGSSPGAVAVGDFNGDGRPDVAAANGGSNTVSVLLNDGAWTPPPPPPPSLRINDVTVTEGHAGTATATFVVTLSAASTETITVSYASGAGTAAAGSDYQAASGTLTFAPGQTHKTITVSVNGDRLGEANETFAVALGAATNATIGDGQGLGTIVDDEPRISVGDVTKAEGRKGQKTLFIFTVTLSAAYDQPVTMSYRTADGTATAGSGDYLARTGTLTIAPGETTKTITIEVKGDSTREPDETFYLDLSDDSTNSLFTKKRGVGTILNDD